jgi:hypothetical protein
MASSVVLWISRDDAPPTEVPLADGCALSASGIGPAAVAPGAPSSLEVTILPSSRVAPAVVIVPDDAPFVLRRNGSRLRPGLHALSHAHSIEFLDFTLWISAEGAPEEAMYDPERHEKEAYCYRTKARLRPGEPIVICPGVPEVPCGAPYKKAAWETGLRCHVCGFDPSRPRWCPPPRAKERSLDELRRNLDLAPL